MLDILFVHKNVGRWHRVRGTERRYDPTGHYPVFGPSGEETFVGGYWEDSDIVHIDKCVKVGGFIVQSEDSASKPFSENFCVFCLRHDPSDQQPPYPCALEGGMDPMGPLHWLPFWPTQHPRLHPGDDDYDQFNIDNLKHFLEVFSTSAHPRDSYHERVAKFWDAVHAVDPDEECFDSTDIQDGLMEFCTSEDPDAVL